MSGQEVDSILTSAKVDRLESQRADGMRVAHAVMKFRALPWQVHSAIYMLVDSYRAGNVPGVKDEAALREFLLEHEAGAVIENVIATVYAHALVRVGTQGGK